MNKLILLLIATICITIALHSCTQSNANKVYFQPRVDTANNNEWRLLKDKHDNYFAKLEQDSTDVATRIKLIEIYLNEARITGNTNHYDALAMQNINTILQSNTVAPNLLYLAISYKASILLTLHQFAEAKKYAMQAQALNPYESDNYGCLIDANIELGNYDTAVYYCDKMVSIRPDLRSYSRVSYIREILGDNAGAIQAMQMAVNAGAAGRENTEWARVQLADLYLNKGALDTAELLYNQALANRSNFVQALIGIAKINEQKYKIDTAIASVEKAINILSESSYISYLGELYALQNNTAKATEINTDVVQLLESTEAENKKEKLIPHNGNRELAQAYLNNKQFTNALKFAINDYNLRPNNIDACELLANIYFKNNDLPNAKLYATKAMRTGKQHKKSMQLYLKIFEANKDEVLIGKAKSTLNKLGIS